MTFQNSNLIIEKANSLKNEDAKLEGLKSLDNASQLPSITMNELD